MNSIDKLFNKTISIEHLFNSWFLFRKGKRKRRDVIQYERFLERNIFNLEKRLLAQKYKHREYNSFFLQDPKVRHIRKAHVEDRLVHQAVYTTLNEIYEPKFIYHMYSSRVGKGTHRAVKNLRKMLRKVSKNNTLNSWALKCDVKRFYDTVDHQILFKIISRDIKDKKFLNLIQQVINSFSITEGKGMPIGNLTSQIFTSIYLNELDRFIKHKLKIKFYMRFADDLIILSRNKYDLEKLVLKLELFLKENLLLKLHPNKISIKPISQGFDFLGYVTFSHYRVLRTVTKRRMLKKLSKRLDEYLSGEIAEYSMNQALQSYLGILSHANTKKLENQIRNQFFFR